MYGTNIYCLGLSTSIVFFLFLSTMYLSDELVQRLPHLRHSHQFAQLVGIQVVQTVKRQVLLVQSANDIQRKLLELVKRIQRLPLTSIDHFAKAEHFLNRKNIKITLQNFSKIHISLKQPKTRIQFLKEK